MKITAYIGKTRPKRLPRGIKHFIPKGRAKSGIECSFFKIGDRGLKLFNKKEDCLYAYKRQKRANEAGIAPRCFLGVQKFLFGKKAKTEKYGYWTEIATPVDEIDSLSKYWRATYISRLEKIRKTHKKLFGYIYCDDHSGNIGIINRKMVIIDWGEESSGAY